MKKIFALALLAAALVFAGCTVVMKMRVNGEKKYTVTTDCGSMEVTCSVTNAHWLRMQVRVTEGQFEIYPGKFTMTTDSGQEITLDWRASAPPENGRIILNKGDVAGFDHSFFESGFVPVEKDRYVIVEPGNSVICNGKPVFTGKLKLQRKGKR